MRLMCPNCDAEYSVDDAAIPPSGRDVQCSNCGHAWFQLHPDAEREAERMDALFGAKAAPVAPASVAPAPVAPASVPPVSVPPAPVPPVPAAPQPAAPPAAQAAPDAARLTGTTHDAPPPPPAAAEHDGPPKADATAAPESPADPEGDRDHGGDEATVVQAQSTPASRTLDENLLAILREEAARETAVRRAEAPGMPEVQQDLGLSATAHAAAPVRETAPAAGAVAADTAAADSEAADTVHATGDRVAPRRDLLPDIEEINSTLRAGSEARGAEAEATLLAEKARAKGGFRAGFVVTLFLAVLLTAAYTMAPRIAEHLPGSAPMMASYVNGVDVARIWLDGAMQQAAGALRGLTGETP